MLRGERVQESGESVVKNNRRKTLFKLQQVYKNKTQRENRAPSCNRSTGTLLIPMITVFIIEVITQYMTHLFANFRDFIP